MHQSKLFTLCFVAFSISIPGFFSSLLAHSGQLSPWEGQIVAYLNEHKPEQLQLLEKWVNINTGSENVKGVQKFGELLRPKFEALGFKTHWEQGPTPKKRAGTLIAEREGKQGKRLLLIAHLDTVFPKDSPFQKFSLSGGSATGPGVVDIKGGDAVILYALKALADAHALENTTIRIALTGDEESSAKPTTLSRKALVDLAKKSDIALDFESASSRNLASIARRGTSSWLLETTGNEGHSSLIFREGHGYGANFELARILNEMRTTLSGEKYLTFSPGIVLGGTEVEFDKSTGRGSTFGKNNIIPKTAMASGDLRCLTPEQRDQAQKKIEEILKHSLPGTSATVKFQESIPPMPPTQGNRKLLEHYSQISEKLGLGEVKELPPENRGAGDISYIASYVSGSLIGIGAVGKGEHSPNETLDADALVTQSLRAALFIHALTHE